jgi:hypothetical protein
MGISFLSSVHVTPGQTMVKAFVGRAICGRGEPPSHLAKPTSRRLDAPAKWHPKAWPASVPVGKAPCGAAGAISCQLRACYSQSK